MQSLEKSKEPDQPGRRMQRRGECRSPRRSAIPKLADRLKRLMKKPRNCATPSQRFLRESRGNRARKSAERIGVKLR